MNICIISQEFPPYTNWGGIAAYNSTFSDIFSQRGNNVTIVSRSSANAPYYEELSNGVKVWRVGMSITRKRFVGRTVDKILHSRAVYKKVSELDKKTKFDIIETTEAGLEGELLLKKAYFREKIVIQCNGSNLIGNLPNGKLRAIHEIDRNWSFKREIASLHKTWNILVTSEATQRFLLSNGIEKKKIQLVYQGINTEKFKPDGKPKSNSYLRVGFVGRLEKPKGIDFIWKVLDKLGPNSGIEFSFKGAIHWADRKDVEKNLKRFSSYATYHEPGSQDEMPKFYNTLHVLLQPSRFENFGLVYVEGMACGLVVFAGKAGGGSEIIENGTTGFVIDPDSDVNFVVEKLLEIKSRMDCFKEMTNAARLDVIKRFSLESCASEKLKYYNNIIKS